MKNINLKFNLKNLTSKFKSTAVLVFYLILLTALVWDIRFLYTAVRQVLLARNVPVNLVISKGVRLNFAEYEAATERVESGRKFLPSAPSFKNPFSSQ